MYTFFPLRFARPIFTFLLELYLGYNLGSIWDLFGIYLGSIWDLGVCEGSGFEGSPRSVRLVVGATA